MKEEKIPTDIYPDFLHHHVHTYFFPAERERDIHEVYEKVRVTNIIYFKALMIHSFINQL